MWGETVVLPIRAKLARLIYPVIATGYSITDGKAAAALDWDMSWAGGAGAIYSTVGDLFRWNEALFGGKILKPASFQAMTTPVKLPPNIDGLNYGFGLVIAELNRLPLISHSGGLNGWSSDLMRLPEQNCTVIALANAMPPVTSFEPATVTRQIAGKLLKAELKNLPPPKEDPSAPDTFFWKIADAQVVFERNDKREVIAARHTQGGNTFRAARITDAELQLTAAALDAILGQYQYGPNVILTVTRDGQSVFGQQTGQPKLQIYPKSAIEFEWRVVKASVTFKKDSEGKVTAATHSQNGTTFNAPKIK